MSEKVFIDCGVNLGQGLSEISKMRNIANKDWDIHLFEPNPYLSEFITKEIINRYPHLNISFSPTAVVARDSPEELEFLLHAQKEYETPIGGGSTLANHDLKESEIEGYEKCNVKTTVLSDFIFNLAMSKNAIDIIEKEDGTKFSCFNKGKLKLILKLDIEGAEYSVIRDLLSSGAAWAINELFVEFRGRRFKEDKRDEEVFLVGELFQRGVVVQPWA